MYSSLYFGIVSSSVDDVSFVKTLISVRPSRRAERSGRCAAGRIPADGRREVSATRRRTRRGACISCTSRKQVRWLLAKRSGASSKPTDTVEATRDYLRKNASQISTHKHAHSLGI